MGRILVFDFMKKDEVCTHVEVDYAKKTINYVNYFDNPIETAFGLNEVTLEEVDDFFKSRCFPETRFNSKEILNRLGLDFYDAEEIVKITHGTLIEDYFWVRFEGETLTWNDVKLPNRQ